MSRQNGPEQPGQRTVAELLAEYGGESQRSSRRRRRRAEDPSETAPQAIIDRVMSDSGQMRAVDADGNPVRSESPWTEPRTGTAPTEAASPGTGAAGAGPPAANAPVPGATQGPPQAPPGGAAPADPPQSAAPPAPQQPAPQQPAPQQPAPQQPAPRGDDAAPASGGANFWAQRFAAAGAPPQAPPRQAEPDAPRDDAEATIQQPAMPPAPPAAPAPPPDQVEGATEQFVPVPLRPPVDPAEETALVDYPQGYDEYGTGYREAEYESYDDYAPAGDDPYDFEPLDADEDDGYEDRDHAAAEPYDTELPAGLDEDQLDDDAESDAEPASTGKEWAMVVLQAGAGLVGGIAVWFGFRWLWTEIAVAALVAALVVTGGLVFIARRYLRTDDMQTILFAVLVGLICTVSPAALLLIGQ